VCNNAVMPAGLEQLVEVVPGGQFDPLDGVEHRRRSVVDGRARTAVLSSTPVAWHLRRVTATLQRGAHARRRRVSAGWTP
jgi:hypothetical protein